MNAATLTRPSAHFLANGFGFRPTMFKKGNGALVLSRVAVFRSGTFRDSWGEQNTWEDIHIQQMVDNFNHLRNNKTFDDVPVRDGHPGWLINNTPGTGAVVGWHTNLVAEKAKAPHDDNEYTYLFADYEVTEPYAAEKIQNGTWRNRSSEIGGYGTNAEAEFWPVYLGFAYVDIPAVEGLKFNSSAGARSYILLGKETQVTHPANGLIGGAAQPAAPVVQPPAPAAPVQHAAPAAPAPAAPAAPAYVFTINGQASSDFAAVQAHILSLEGFAKETTESNRRAFVKGLVSENKIAAPTEDDVAAFVVSLSPEQYEAWKKPYATAPALPLLAQHGAPSTAGSGATTQGAGTDAKAEEISVAREIVARHRRAGADAEAIKKTASYKKLISLGVAETDI